jgi:hypothetical protein
VTDQPSAPTTPTPSNTPSPTCTPVLLSPCPPPNP